MRSAFWDSWRLLDVEDHANGLRMSATRSSCGDAADDQLWEAIALACRRRLLAFEKADLLRIDSQMDLRHFDAGCRKKKNYLLFTLM